MITPAVPAGVSRSSTAASQLHFAGTIASAVLTRLRRASRLPATSIVLPGSLFSPAVGTGPATPVDGEADGPLDELLALVDLEPEFVPLAAPGGPDGRGLVKYGFEVNTAETITATRAATRHPASSGIAIPDRRNGARQRMLR